MSTPPPVSLSAHTLRSLPVERRKLEREAEQQPEMDIHRIDVQVLRLHVEHEVPDEQRQHAGRHGPQTRVAEPEVLPEQAGDQRPEQQHYVYETGDPELQQRLDVPALVPEAVDRAELVLLCE